MDKARTMDAAIALRIPVPPTRVLKSLDGALEAAHELGYPVILKPRFSRHWTGRGFIASNGVGYANSDAQLSALIHTLDPELPPPLVQRFVPGTGVGVCLLLSPDGAVHAEFAHERLRDYRPTGSGSVLRRSIPMDPQLRAWSVALLRHIGCRGVAMVEFRVDPETGQHYLMEINGRFWGSLQLAVDAGVNFPRLLLDMLCGKPIRKPIYREDVMLRWWLGDLIRTLRVLKGRPAGYTGKFPSRRCALREFLGDQPAGTRNELLRRNDWRPGLMEPLCMIRRFFQ
jgi:predicted ATP-grasp superfamily ATP-dependent carboligase